MYNMAWCQTMTKMLKQHPLESVNGTVTTIFGSSLGLMYTLYVNNLYLHVLYFMKSKNILIAL